MEVLQGNWKKALLSFAGYFGQSEVWIGLVGKIYLDLFYAASSTEQKNMITGTFRVTKSIIVGLLINLFKITAPYSIRIKAIEAIKKLAEKTYQTEDNLAKAGLPSQTEPFTLHNWLENNPMKCASEIQELINSGDESVIFNVILSLLGFPTTKEAREQGCPQFIKYIKQEGYSSWNDLLVAEGLNRLISEELEQEQEQGQGQESKEEQKQKSVKEPTKEGSNEEGKEDEDVKEYQELMKQIGDLRKELATLKGPTS
jgi:hypothetical protein